MEIQFVTKFSVQSLKKTLFPNTSATGQFDGLEVQLQANGELAVSSLNCLDEYN